MKRFVGLLAALCLVACATAPAPSADGAPDWMSGYWLSCDDGVETAENWIGAGRGVLLGTNITRANRVSYEFLRIAPNASGGLSYFSMPNGRAPPTEFVLIAREPMRVMFENPAHDFPQRVVYWRDGDVLHARIEGVSDGRAQAMDWVFRRAAADAVCG